MQRVSRAERVQCGTRISKRHRAVANAGREIGTIGRAAVGIVSVRGGQRYVFIESTGQFSIRHELEEVKE